MSAESPWPGLIAYQEKDHKAFFGRDAEATALLRAVRREPLTVLFGQSGLGKTSLLQASVFPRLRECGGFPVRVRLAFDPKASPLTHQVLDGVAKAAHDVRELYPDNPEFRVIVPQLDREEVDSGLTLWEYFHNPDHYLWTERNRLAAPVLIFDQFEEWFTRGADWPPQQRRAFLEQLRQVLDNEPPKHIDPRRSWNFDRVPLTIVIALREDYFAHLTSLRQFLPNLHASELRLVPFTQEQARAVIEKPAPWPTDERFTDATLSVLRKAEGAVVSAPTDPDYDPAIISLLLNRLFPVLRSETDPTNRARHVSVRGHRVLRDFYEEALTTTGANDKERVFLEEHLVTHGGMRNSVALEDAIARDRHGIRREVLEKLRDARLVHFDNRALGHQRVELSHDVLCGILTLARDERRQREKSLGLYSKYGDIGQKSVTRHAKIGATSSQQISRSYSDFLQSIEVDAAENLEWVQGLQSGTIRMATSDHLFALASVSARKMISAAIA